MRRILVALLLSCGAPMAKDPAKRAPNHQICGCWYEYSFKPAEPNNAAFRPACEEALDSDFVDECLPVCIDGRCCTKKGCGI